MGIVSRIRAVSKRQATYEQWMAAVWLCLKEYEGGRDDWFDGLNWVSRGRGYLTETDIVDWRRLYNRNYTAFQAAWVAVQREDGPEVMV